MPENFDLFLLKFETLISFNFEKEKFPKKLSQKYVSEQKLVIFRSNFVRYFAVFLRYFAKNMVNFYGNFYGIRYFEKWTFTVQNWECTVPHQLW